MNLSRANRGRAIRYRFGSCSHSSEEPPMAYSEFTLETVDKLLGVSFRQEKLFPEIASVPLSPWLREALNRGQELPLLNERARSELVVMPILLECRKVSGGKLTIYPGQQ